MSKSYNLPKRLAQQAMRECDNQLRAQHKKGIFHADYKKASA